MQVELRDHLMLVVDCETNSVVERFERHCVERPEAFSRHNDIYNNIIVFSIRQQQSEAAADSPSESNKTTGNRLKARNPLEAGLQPAEGEPTTGELHIFQCVSHRAQQLVAAIETWKAAREANGKSDGCGQGEDGNKMALAGSKSSAGEDRRPAGSRGANKSPVVVTAASGPAEAVPLVNVNVKETVQVFNQIAALREKR